MVILPVFGKCVKWLNPVHFFVAVNAGQFSRVGAGGEMSPLVDMAEKEYNGNG